MQPTIDEVQETLGYNPLTGEVWNKKTGNFIFGECISIKNARFIVEKCIWLLIHGEWPPKGIIVDHKDRDRTNRKLNNLRLATYSQNGINAIHPNSNGIRGITYDPTRAKHWRAQIRINGIKTNLGRFYTKEEAVRVYEEAAKKHHGEFNV